MKPKHLAPAQSRNCLPILDFQSWRTCEQRRRAAGKGSLVEEKESREFLLPVSTRLVSESEVVTYDAVGFSRMNQPHGC
jgi:hypothetical protein